jgi:tetratricopeptide (TPR) repeat protein
MQGRKKKIYIGSIIIAMLGGIYIINAKLGGVISKIFVNKTELKTEEKTGADGINKIFESKEFGAVVLANMVKDEKDPEKAKKIIEEAVKDVAEEEKYKLYYNLANSYYVNGDYQNSIYYIDKAIAHNSECYTCYNMRGNANMFLNKIEESLQDYTKGLNIKEETILYTNRSLLYSDYLHSNAKAIADLSNAIKLDNNFDRPKYLLFTVYFKNKNMVELKRRLTL